MTIFKTYTGNAMLNNSLMTIEALAGLQSVEEITPALLLELYDKVDLKSLNKRLKSYTMLFTKNGPLHNDKINGEKVYNSLLKTIIDLHEDGGCRVCEVSGLRFSKPFEQIYEEALKKVGFTEKDIRAKDITINRGWFPLIGGLGSDAQALPQAKFSVQIHPICVAILQFLPLSSLLYNGGILLIDSSNFDFAKSFIRENQKLLWEKIKTTPVSEPVENIKDFNKGHYILKAVEILEKKEAYEEAYSDLNLWSFSNLGTGASCSIDRVPNSLIRKLMTMDKNSKIGTELKDILNNSKSSYSFLEDLEANKEWWLLYPNKFKAGKKEVTNKGVSVDFLEAYFEATNNEKLIEYAKYVAGLVSKYKTKSFEKYLDKYDAWNESEYRVDLYTVLVTATEKSEWSLLHQIEILDNKNLLPAKNTYYQLHKLIHFYYQKNHFTNVLPEIHESSSSVLMACNWLITLIKKDINQSRIVERLTDKNDYTSVVYTELLIRSVQNNDISLKDIATILYSEDYKQSHYGMNELLRIFFSQKEQLYAPAEKPTVTYSTNIQRAEQWFSKIQEFATDYQQYYYEKYKHNETGDLPISKFKKLIGHIALETSKFLQWLSEAFENTNEFIKESTGIKDKWAEEDLLYTPDGEISLSLSKLATKLLLTKQSLINTKEQLT
ncbi:MAG TPA: hypothetical protein VFW07_24810 [Parafilimonas sp.]|nr:hypothetical protein [Parafilimonas sp.]